MKNVRKATVYGAIWGMLMLLTFAGCNASAQKADEAMQAYHAVLMNEMPFYSVNGGENYLLNRYDRSVEGYAVWRTERFAVIDMDGDGIPEVVLALTTGFDGAFEVMHYEDGKVYGFNHPYRGMLELTADGTYVASNGASESVFLKAASIKKDVYTTETLAYSTSSGQDINDISYYIGDKKVSKDDYDVVTTNLWDKMNKNAAVWYEFTDADIASVFPPARTGNEVQEATLPNVAGDSPAEAVSREASEPEQEETPPIKSETYTGEALIAMQAFKTALLNETAFYATHKEKDLKISELECLDIIDDQPLKLSRFAVADMDGDGIPEVVFDFGSPSCSSHILYCEDGKVYGLHSVHYICDLSDDGTTKQTCNTTGNEFIYFKTVSVNKNRYHEEKIASAFLDRFETGEWIYYINEAAVPKKDFDGLLVKHYENQVEWHDFTEENINFVFP